VDTKWKLPESNNPADSDLKQMFVYNEFWDSGSALLLYPAATYSKLIEFKSGSFKKGKDHLHRCGMLKISVLDESNKKLDRDLGERLSNFIEEEFKRCLKLFPIN
jgi:5-methylcytosine-specific restriction enzyme subunit McrC